MANTSITRFAQSVVSVANETAGKVGCMHLLSVFYELSSSFTILKKLSFPYFSFQGE